MPANWQPGDDIVKKAPDTIHSLEKCVYENKKKSGAWFLSLEELPIESCDDDFVFDNEMLALVKYHGFKTGEISCPTKYFPEASSINFARSCKYGFGVLGVSIKYFLAYTGIYKSKIFKQDAKKLDINAELPYYHQKKED